jgi:peroxiredoxin
MTQPSPWMRYVLIAAAVHQIAWGVWAVAFPLAPFHLAGLPEPLYPEVWQAAGVLVAALGVGCGLAALNPLRHWPSVAAGLFAKVLGSLGIVLIAARGRVPWSLAWPVVVSDVVWWLPFGLILKAAYDAHVNVVRSAPREVLSLAMNTRTDEGVAIGQLSRSNPLLLVFLRHAGCTFCREALSDIARQREAIESAGATIVLVHMGDPGSGRELLAKYGLNDLPRISNPSRALYRAFGLSRGTLGMLLGPRVWVRGFQSAVLNGHGAGPLMGDGFQMPGVFVIFHGQVLRSFRHTSPADRPDYAQFVRLDVGETVL